MSPVGIERPKQSSFSLAWCKWLAIAVGGILLVTTLKAAQLSAVRGRPWYEYYVYPIVGLVLVLGFRKAKDALSGMSDGVFIGLTILAFTVSRLGWILFMPSLPFSDFAVYDWLASLLSQYKPIPQDMIIFHSWGYPLFLSPFYALFGESILVSQGLNVVLGAVSVWLLYRLVCPISGPLVARVTTLLFVLWPNQLMLTSIPASEHLALATELAALVLVVQAVDAQHISYRRLVLAGVLLALTFMIRPALISVAVASLFLLFVSRQSLKHRLVQVAVTLTCFLAAYAAYVGLLKLVYHATPSSYWATFLKGTNYDAGGGWNEEDTDSYRSLVEDASPQKANRYVREETLRRITSDPLRFVALMGSKIQTLWDTDSFGAAWSTRRLGFRHFSSDQRQASSPTLPFSDLVVSTVAELETVGNATVLQAVPYGVGFTFNGQNQYLRQKAHATQQGDLTYGHTTFVDEAQDFSDWQTLERDARFLLVVTNTDGSVGWGYVGPANSTVNTNDTVVIYRDIPLRESGWNGVHSGKTPLSYEIRSAAFQLIGKSTLGAWVKFTSIAKTQNIIGKSGRVGQYGYRLLKDSNDRLRMVLSLDGRKSIAYVESTLPISKDTWYHVVGVFDGGYVRLYVDGEEAGAPVAVDTLESYDTHVPLTVAARSDSIQLFDGSIAAPFVCACGLEDVEIAEMYRVGKSILDAGEKIQEIASRLRPKLLAVSQYYHVLILVLGLFGIACISKGKPNAGLTLMLVLLLAGTVLHMIVEVQPRYSWGMRPTLLLLAATGLLRICCKDSISDQNGTSAL